MSSPTKIRFGIERNLLRMKRAALFLIDWFGLHLGGPIHTNLASESGRRVVLFVGDYLQGRIPRLAKWVNRSGDYECILLVAAGKDYSILDQNAFSCVLTFRSKPHLRRILRGLEGVSLIQAFSLPSYHIKLAIDEADVPVIMDAKDMYVSYFGLDSPLLYMRLEIPNEKEAIRGAAGIVCHSMEMADACRTYGITKRPPTLFFPVYCDDDLMVDPPLPASTEFHVVYVGAIAGSFQDDKHFGSMKLFWLIEALTGQGVHLHIYPSPAIRFRDLILSEYEREADSNPYFHLHESVPLRDLAREMSQYHFGILPFYLEDTGRSATKLGRGSSLKLFNYLEAGLPVMISKDLEFQNWIAARYGAALTMAKTDYSRFHDILNDRDYEQMRRNVTSMRHRITIGKNVQRLLDFYDRILDEASRRAE